MTNVLTPTLVGVYVDNYGLSIAQAGYSAAAYMAGGGVGAAIVSALLFSTRTRLMLALGLCALALGNWASMYTHSISSILAVRLLAGLGEGVGFALMGAGIARMRNPNRVYGVFVLLMLLMSAGVQYSIPWLRFTFGVRWLFIPIALAPGILLVFVPLFRDLRSLTRLNAEGAAPTPASPPETSRGYFWCGALATGVLYIAFGAQFAYIERIGVTTGIARDTVASILGTGYFIAAAGAVAMIATANQGGLPWKISVSLSCVALATILTIAGNALSYRVGVSIEFLAWYYFAPNLLALLSRAEPSGRLTAAAMGTMEWGIAIGPAVAALGIQHGSFVVVAVIAVCGFTIGFLFLIPVFRHLRDMAAFQDTAVTTPTIVASAAG